MQEIQVTTERKTQLVDITSDVHDAVGSDAQGSAALVYVPHTTAGIIINEKIDPDLLDDDDVVGDQRFRLKVRDDPDLSLKDVILGNHRARVDLQHDRRQRRSG